MTQDDFNKMMDNYILELIKHGERVLPDGTTIRIGWTMGKMGDSHKFIEVQTNR